MSILYLVGTPIGNLEDITFRAVRILSEVSAIYCEDTRVTSKLCKHYNIHTTLKSYHEHNKEKATINVLNQLSNNENVALVSDAGCPSISDPGYDLVNQVRENGHSVETIPGPNAGITALMTSGLSSYKFTFLGFLPRHQKEKANVLTKWMNREATIIIYESPYRVKQTLQAISEIDGYRKISIGRELTKKFEQVTTDSVKNIQEKIEDNSIPQKGEFVILVEGINEEDKSEKWWEDLTIEEHVQKYITDNSMTSKEAIKQVSIDRNMKKREVYEIYHIQ